MKAHDRLTIHDIGGWLERRRRSNQSTILLLGSRAGASYRSLPFYNYCEQYIDQKLETYSPIWSFRECYKALVQRNLGERELHALFQHSLKNVINLPDEEDHFLAEIVRKGYFREIISTNIDDIVEQALSHVGLIEGTDLEVLIPGKLIQEKKALSNERELSYRLTKVFGDWLSREYTIYNRESYIIDNNELHQYLHSILHGHVLVIGIDPLWDQSILSLLHDTPTTLWFVNEEVDIVNDQQVASISGQTQSVAILGQNCTYEEVWRSLYQQLCMERMLKDRVTQNWHSSLIKDDDYNQKGKNAIRILYIYCDDDFNTMQKFWKHLHILKSNQLITDWHRGLLMPGDHLQLTQERELRRSQLIIVGFSSNFIASEYYDQALQALTLSHSETVRLIPLLLSPVGNWKQTPFCEITPSPREGKTLSELSSKELEKELSKIADDIHELVKRLQKSDDNY